MQINRQREKLEKNLGSITDMTRLPGAIFVVDVKKEHIAVAEAQNLNIPIFALVDTNSDPRPIDYVIPANDDASKSIEKVLGYIIDGVANGLAERKAGKEKAKEVKEVKVVKEEVVAETTEAPKAEKAKKKVVAKTAEAPKATETSTEETK